MENIKKLHKDFNKHLSNLAVANFKLHNVHWNVAGPNFIAIHEFTEKLYDEVFENFDQVAEHQKMYEALPFVKMSEYLENATIKEINSKPFNTKEALDTVKEILDVLREDATELRNECDEAGWFSAVGMLEGHIESYNKHIWMIRQMGE